MSNETNVGAENAIVATILAQAESQSRQIVDDARTTAAQLTDTATHEANILAAEILAVAENKAAKLRARERALAAVQARKMLLGARETAIGHVIARVRAGLDALQNDSGKYKQSLHVLAAEAACAIAEPDISLRLDETARDSMGAETTIALIDSIRLRSGADTNVNCTFVSIGPGCIASSLNGRVVLDNTYQARLQRMLPTLRASIARQLDERHA